MPQQPRQRRGKRKRPPEQVPSSSSLEVFSSVRRGGRATKKRAVEKLDYELPSPVAPPDDNVLLDHSSQPDPSTSVDITDIATSRSVSVSVVFVLPRHLLTLSQSKVQEWLPHRAEYYYTILRTEAPLLQNPTCLTCKPAEHECLCDSAAEYRCLACSSGELVCKGCLLSRHAATPLHRVRVCLSIRICLLRRSINTDAPIEVEWSPL